MPKRYGFLRNARCLRRSFASWKFASIPNVFLVNFNSVFFHQLAKFVLKQSLGMMITLVGNICNGRIHGWIGNAKRTITTSGCSAALIRSPCDSRIPASARATNESWCVWACQKSKPSLRDQTACGYDHHVHQQWSEHDLETSLWWRCRQRETLVVQRRAKEFDAWCWIHHARWLGKGIGTSCLYSNGLKRTFSPWIFKRPDLALHARLIWNASFGAKGRIMAIDPRSIEPRLRCPHTKWWRV